MKTLQILLPRVLVLFALVASMVALRDSSPPAEAVVAPPSYHGVLMQEVTLEQQAREAGLIIYGTVSGVTPRKTGSTLITEVTLEVGGALRGNTGSTFKFSLDGGVVGGVGLTVGGVPHFLEGERVLLFFETPANKRLLRRWQGKYTLAGPEAIQLESKTRVPVSSLDDRLGRALNKKVDLPKDGPGVSSDPFTAVGHNNTGQPYNCPAWATANMPIVVDVNPAGPGTGGPTGTNFARLVYDSLHSWQALNDSYAAFSFGQITTRGSAVDGLNTAGWSNSLGAGVLGVNNCAWFVGGSRYDSDTLIASTFTWDADSSNGVTSSAYSLEAVLEHELGHGLSLGHTEVTCNGLASTPLMCPAVSSGVRKTILADDSAGAAFLYPITGSPPGAPTNLAITGSGSSRTLNWTASTGTKHAYDIERSSTGCAGAFKSINTVAGNVTTFADNNYGDGLGAGNWCYRVKALGTGGDSAWSNTASGAAATATPTPTATNTPAPTATNTPLPTATNTPPPTATNTPAPTATNTPAPTATNTPPPTATNTPVPTATNTPAPTNSPTPPAYNTGGEEHQLSTLAIDGHVELFGRSVADQLISSDNEGGSFAEFSVVTAGVTSRPEAVLVGSNLYVFYRGQSEDVRYIVRSDNTWGESQSLGGSIAGAPVAAVDGDGDVVLFALNTSGGILSRRLSNSEWTAWITIPGILSGQLSVAEKDGNLHLMGLNPTGRTYVRTWLHASNGWTPWYSLAGVLEGQLAGAAYGSKFFVMGINPNGVTYHRAFNGANWTGWTSLQGVLNVSPAAITSSAVMHVVGTHSSGRIYERRFNGTSWTQWSNLAGTFATGPELATLGDDLYIFATGPNGETSYRLWNGSSWGPWVNLGGAFAIAE